MAVDQEEHKGEADLGGAEMLAYDSKDLFRLYSHIEDTVGDDLSVDSDLVDTLGQGPDNGVGGP